VNGEKTVEIRFGEGFGVCGTQGDCTSSMWYFDARIGAFIGVKYTLFFQSLVFRANLREKFGFDVFLCSVLLVYHSVFP